VSVLFRVYLEMLRRLRHVDDSLDPMGLASLAAALHPQEPSNFMFCYLLSTGEVDRVCKNFRLDSEGTSRRLLHLLSHVFNHIPVPEGMAVPETTDDDTSQVVLDPLPPELDQILRGYEQFVMSVFASCIERASHDDPSVEDEKLPISAGAYSDARQPSGGLAGRLSERALTSRVQSPFATTTGRASCVFDSPAAFSNTARPGLLVDGSQVPVVAIVGPGGQRLRLNAAALDYYRLVSKVHLVRDNGFKEAKAWELLSNWNKLLSTIHSNLGRMIKNPQNSVTLDAFEYLATEFKKKFDRFNEVRT